VIEWQNLENQAYVILHDPQVIEIDGSLRYGNAITATSNLGEAMSEAMIERAELSRYAIEKRAILDAKIRQRERVAVMIEDLKNGVALKEAALAMMHEQTYDVRMDLNEALLQFCQAYFYENHMECSDEARPEFGGDLGSLLNKIQAARNDSMLEESIPPSVDIAIVMTDTNTDPECSDVTQCPVNYLRNHRVLHYKMPINHTEFQGYERCRINEIELDAPGVISIIPGNNNAMFRIEATGNFYGRNDGTVYTFNTRPISLGFRYDIESGFISIRADIYDPFQGIFNHMTPFTTWVIAIHENYGHIDLREIKEFHMRVKGSCYNV
jgi:hypothetical protein